MNNNINDLDPLDPYRRRFDFRPLPYSGHDTRSGALGFDFCENPSLFRKPSLPTPPIHTSSFWAPKVWPKVCQAERDARVKAWEDVKAKYRRA